MKGIESKNKVYEKDEDLETFLCESRSGRYINATQILI